jgi:hypothetical protein
MVTDFVGNTPNCTCPNIDCSVPGSCEETKYGLGATSDWDTLPFGFRDDLVAAGVLTTEPVHTDFDGGYVYSRGSTGVDSCQLGETAFNLQMGTWLIRERPVCTAPGVPAGCCDPLDTATNPTGCPVKLALDANLENPGPAREHVFTERRHLADFNICGGPPNFPRCEFFGRIASTGTGYGVGHRIPNTATDNAECTGPRTPQICCTGLGTGRCDVDTRVKFDMAMGTPGGVQSKICCNSQQGDARDICTVLLGAAGGVDKYPLIGGLLNTSDVYVNFNDLEFDANPVDAPYGSWEVDKDHFIPGQRYGVCKENRRRPCDCGPTGSGTVAGGCVADGDNNDPCPGLGDICDLREIGWRLNPADRILTPGPNYGRPNPGVCNKGPFVFRGTPRRNCLVGTTYEHCVGGTNDGGICSTIVDCPGGGLCLGAGDPGPDCAVLSFGANQRPDLNCDGVADELGPNAGTDSEGNDDLCPSYSETNMIADADGDGRGDECECGDANGDGTVDVRDIVATNVSIFAPPAFPTVWFHQPPYGTCADSPDGCFRRILTPLADANNSPFDPTPSPSGDVDRWETGGVVDVSDIVQINIDTFNTNNARCGRSPIQGE